MWILKLKKIWILNFIPVLKQNYKFNKPFVANIAYKRFSEVRFFLVCVITIETMLNYISKLLKIDIDLIKNELFLENNKNNQDCAVLKEKLLILRVYYNFINNENCMSFIYTSYDALSANKVHIKNFQFTDDDILTITVLILKSFLKKTNFIDSSEKFINSDEILNDCVDQFKKYLILLKIHLSDKDIRIIFFYAINVLINKGTIVEKTVHFREKMIKTVKHYQLPNMNYTKSIEESFNHSFDEFKIIKWKGTYYAVTYHYSKTFEIFKKNFYSNKNFKLKDNRYLKDKINVKLYVDKEFQQDLKKITKIEDITELKEMLKKKLTELSNFNLLNTWTSETKSKIITLQQQISNLEEKIIIYFYSQWSFSNNFIIFPLFWDFRGRKYYDSIISPTNSKYLRLSYFYGYYDKNDFEVKSKYTENYTELIKNFCVKNNLTDNLLFYNAYYWCLIGIGKLFIKKNKCPISELEFLETAILNYNNETTKIVDNLELYHYKRILNSLTEDNLKNNLIKKRGISKDATASLNQIFMKKLGPIDQESLNYVNLGFKNEWYDTYAVHIQKFYDYILSNPRYAKYTDINAFNDMFSRNLIKKIVMIIPYSAGFDECWKNYIKEIEKSKSPVIIDKNLKVIMRAFYEFVKNEMQVKYLYKRSSDELINELNINYEKNRECVLKTKTGEADISYKKLKKESIDRILTINGVSKRITKQMWSPGKAIDIEAFNKSSAPNFIHFNDAYELRLIETKLKYCIITIHDCYIIDFNNCDKLVNIKIAHYQSAIAKFDKKYKINNSFILL